MTTNQINLGSFGYKNKNKTAGRYFLIKSPLLRSYDLRCNGSGNSFFHIAETKTMEAIFFPP